MTITRRQEVSASGHAGTPAAVTWSEATISGNLLLAFVTIGAPSFTITPPSNWVLAESAVSSAELTSYIYYYANAPASSGSVSFTIGGTDSANANWWMAIAEYAGMSATPLDQVSAAHGSGTNPDSGATPTTTNANELWVGCIGGYQSHTGVFSSPTNGFSIVDQGTAYGGTWADFAGCYTEKIVSATGAAETGVTPDASIVQWAACAATFYGNTIAVQETSGNGGTGPTTTIALSWLNPTTAGNLLLALIDTYGTPTITPPSGWILATSDNYMSTCGSYIFYYPNAPSQSGSMSFSCNSSIPGSWIALAEYAGYSDLDQVATGSIVGSGVTTSGTTPLTTSATQLWIATFCNFGGGTWRSPTNGFSIVAQGYTAILGGYTEKVVTTPGTAVSEVTYSGGTQTYASAVIATFRSNAGTAAGSSSASGIAASIGTAAGSSSASGVIVAGAAGSSSAQAYSLSFGSAVAYSEASGSAGNVGDAAGYSNATAYTHSIGHIAAYSSAKGVRPGVGYIAAYSSAHASFPAVGSAVAYSEAQAYVGDASGKSIGFSAAHGISARVGDAIASANAKAISFSKGKIVGSVVVSGVSFNHGHAASYTIATAYAISADSAAIGSSSALAKGVTGSVAIGSSSASAVSLLCLSFPFVWADQVIVTTGINFTWNDGTQPTMWYRLTGSCQGPNANLPVAGGPLASCQQQYVQNVFATSISNLCETLTAQNWTWPISSIEQYSIPADNSFVTSSDTVNTLSPVVNYCDVPSCLNFCLQSDVVESMVMQVTVTIVYFQYIGSGSIIVGGSAPVDVFGCPDCFTGPDFECLGNGNIIVNGSAECVIISYDVGYETQMAMSGEIQDFEVIFSTQDDAPQLFVPTNTVFTNCQNCTTLPLVLYLNHNLNQAAVLTNFLTANGFTMPTSFALHYSNVSGEWQAALHYTGISANSQSNETWRLSFEWGCVDTLAAQDLGGYVWKFAITVLRRNYAIGMDLDTKLLIVFPPKQICPTTTGIAFDFIFSVDTQQITAITSTGIAVQVLVLYDNIGLFTSQYWVNNPLLSIKIAQGPQLVNYTTLNIAPIFPVEPAIT